MPWHMHRRQDASSLGQILHQCTFSGRHVGMQAEHRYTGRPAHPNRNSTLAASVCAEEAATGAGPAACLGTGGSSWDYMAVRLLIDERQEGK
mmetsp:Transcript_103546/g.178434  ORF Transcript_103546/g.178434 Transcript_103546/m.178434 type:complete len:92 (-) Transcript_103546:166-441(-)